MKKYYRVILSLLALSILLLFVLVINTIRFESKQLNSNGDRKKYNIDHGAVSRLAGAIRIPTISYDDTALMDRTSFENMTNYIDSCFPGVSKTLHLIKINSYTLIYHWQAKANNSQPSILYAHLDVVPVEEQTKDQWLHDPWSGDTAQGFIWGRGALDDKGSVFGILEATESLIKQGYVPQNDIYLVFGHDEEVGGRHGAALAAKYFENNGITTKFNLDEGGMCSEGIVPFVDRPVILAGTAEKGYVTLTLTVKIKGGHSSKPEKETSTGVLTKALAKLDAYKFPQKMSPVMKDFITYSGPEMKAPYNMIFANTWLFKPLILKAYENISAEGNALTRTTHAITLINAGIKENLIPGIASAKVNFRIITGESVESVISTVKDQIDDDRVKITITGHATEPSPVTALDSYGFKITQSVSSRIFPDAVFVPFLMLGGTDSKHFEKVSESLIRCLPVRMSSEQLRTVHGVNERIGIHDYMEMIAFYKELIRSI